MHRLVITFALACTLQVCSNYSQKAFAASRDMILFG